MRILLLSTGRRVSLIRHLKRAAKELKIDLFILGTEINQNTPSLYFCDHFELVPKTNTKEFHLAILELIKAHNISHILPGNDLDLLYLANNQLPVEIIGPEPHYYRPFLQKSLGSQEFLKAGLLIPEIYQAEPLKYPAILKEDYGYGSQNQYILNEKADYDFYLKKLQKPFIQEFISGLEYTIDIFCDFNYKPISMVARLREKVANGVSIVGKVDQNSDLLKLLNQVIPKFKLRGAFNIQCLHKEQKFYFLEINPRYSGGIPLTIKAGADLPKLSLQMALKQELEQNFLIKNGLSMLKLDAEIFLDNNQLRSGIGYEI